MTALSSKKGRSSDDTATAKLDAHDIANRIMRQENYLIALFNKELLDLRVPLPAVLKQYLAEEKGKGKLLTQALEWNLRFCLMEYLFDEHGKVRKVFLKSKNRTVLIEGCVSALLFKSNYSRFNFQAETSFYLHGNLECDLCAIYRSLFSDVLFFHVFRGEQGCVVNQIQLSDSFLQQYHKNPSAIGGRRYTSFAQWKFREFNELPHIFVRRLDESYPLANMYIGQFPNEKMTIVVR